MGGKSALLSKGYDQALRGKPTISSSLGNQDLARDCGQWERQHLKAKQTW